MLAACTLLVIAVVSGTLLTFLYDRSAPFPARLCIGACTGMALLAVIGFLFALWLGLNAASIGLAAFVLLLPFLFLARRSFRESFVPRIGLAARRASIALRYPIRRTAVSLIFYCGM